MFFGIIYVFPQRICNVVSSKRIQDNINICLWFWEVCDSFVCFLSGQTEVETPASSSSSRRRKLSVWNLDFEEIGEFEETAAALIKTLHNLSRYQGQGHAENANQSKKTVFQIFQAQTNHRHTKYLCYIIYHMLDIQTRQLQFEFTKTLPTLSPFLLGRKRRKVKVNWQNNLEYICGNIHYLKEKKIPHQSGLFNNNRSGGKSITANYTSPPSRRIGQIERIIVWRHTYMSYSTLAHHCLLSIDTAVFCYWYFALEILNSW